MDQRNKSAKAATESEMQMLQRLLQESREQKQQAEEQRQQAQEELQQEKEQRQQERRRAEEAEERQQQAEEQQQQTQEELQQEKEYRQPTTMDEYIASCHSLVFDKLVVETDKNLTTECKTTNPVNKWCPTWLEPWENFLELQKTAFGAACSVLPTQERAFESRAFLSGLGKRVSRSHISNEKRLEHFQHSCVEDPVRTIMSRFIEEAAFRDQFGIGQGLVFENHPTAIRDAAEQQPPKTPTGTPDEGQVDRNRLRPDQICVYTQGDGESTTRRMAYVEEYKAPHILTPPHFRVALHAMDILKEVVNRATIPTKDDANAFFQYHAERLVMAAITQTYHYMIEGGLEYGVLTSGEVMVFLNIDWRTPGTLYYHLAEPGPEVLAHPDNFRSCTAVAQMLAFSLLAIGPPGRTRQHGQQERERVMANLKTWLEEYMAILHSIPLTARVAPPESPGFEPTTYRGVDRSPYLLRGRRQRNEPNARPPATRRTKSPKTSDDEAGPFAATPTPAPRQRGKGRRAGARSLVHRQRGGGGGEAGNTSRQYCTQKCLGGLVAGGVLDKKCPNVALHRRSNAQTHHPVPHDQWLQLLGKQLQGNLDDGVERLDKEGARGVLFQITMLEYGYTFVGKGTVAAFVPHLEHEAAVYGRLRKLQGINVPVFLGNVDLRPLGRTYYYDFRVYIIHLTFLSWGGESLNTFPELFPDNGERDKSLQGKLVRAVRKLHKAGVVHTDVRHVNVLLDKESGRIMIIDFERALLLEQPRPRAPLEPLVPNKLRNEVCEKTARPSRGITHRFEDDILMAKAI